MERVAGVTGAAASQGGERGEWFRTMCVEIWKRASTAGCTTCSWCKLNHLLNNISVTNRCVSPNAVSVVVCTLLIFVVTFSVFLLSANSQEHIDGATSTAGKRKGSRHVMALLQMP